MYKKFIFSSFTLINCLNYLLLRRLVIIPFIFSASNLSDGPHCANTNDNADESFCS